METVVILIMFMVGLSFVLKLTFMSPWQMLAEVVVPEILCANIAYRIVIRFGGRFVDI